MRVCSTNIPNTLVSDRKTAEPPPKDRYMLDTLLQLCIAALVPPGFKMPVTRLGSEALSWGLEYPTPPPEGGV